MNCNVGNEYEVIKYLYSLECLLKENYLVYVNVSNYVNIKVEKNFKSIFIKVWYFSRKFGFGMKIYIYLIIMLFCIEFLFIYFKKWKGCW